jgi:hypothetical protein
MDADLLALRGRRQCIRVARLPKLVRAQPGELRSNVVVELDHDIYRPSTIAVYSSYQLPAPPIRALTSEWEDPLTPAGNAADI